MDDRHAGRRARCFNCDGALIIPEPAHANEPVPSGGTGLIDAPPDPEELRADPPPFLTGAAPPPKKPRPRPTEG